MNVNIKLGSTAADRVATEGLIIENGVLKKLDAAVTGTFTVAKVTVTTKSLRFQWMSEGANTRFEMTRTASVAFTVGGKQSNADVTFGVDGKPGLVITNGSFESISLLVNGNFSVSSLTFVAEKLVLNYDAKTETFTAQGTVNITVKNSKLSLKLGSTTKDGVATEGLVIQSGILTKLDAQITGGFSFGKASFAAKALRFTYQNDNGATRFEVKGAAGFTFTSGGKPSTIDVEFTTRPDSANPAGKPGLVLVDGDFQSFSIKANGNLTISSLQFTAKDLFIAYDATKSLFTARGEVDVDSKQVKLNIKLGSTTADGLATDGLVIENGSLKKLDAMITSSFEFSKVKFATDKLRFTYQTKVENGKETSRFEVSGSASMSFTAGGSLSTIGVTFGTPTTAGLVFVDGKFKSIDLTTNADIKIKGLTLTAKNLRITYNADTGKFTASGAMSFHLAPGNKSTRVQIDIELGKNGTEGIAIENGELKKLDASVTSSFEFSKFKFSTKDLRFQYSNVGGNTRFELTGTASLEFTVGGQKSNVSVTFGIAGNPGLVIENGSFRYMTVQVNGSLNLIGLSITARKLTIKYDANQSEFIMYGEIGVSTAAKGGKKVLDNVTVKMGSENFDAPGIKITDGNLERLDLTLTGAVNLGPLTATAETLRAVYARSDGNLFITGGVKLEFGKGRYVAVGFSGRGLQINTITGDVQLHGLRVAIGGIRFKVVVLKDLEIEWVDNGDKGFTIKGSMTVVVGEVLEYKGSLTLEFKNNSLYGIKFSFRGNPGLFLGALQIRELDAEVTGLGNTDTLQISGRVKGVIPVVGGVNLLTLDGNLKASKDEIRVDANAVIFNENLLKGNATIIVDLKNSKFKFNSNVEGLAGILRGNVGIELELKTGYFRAQANVDLVTPGSIPLVGGKEVGSIGINASYGQRSGIGYEVILPSDLKENQPEDFMNIDDQIETSNENDLARKYSSDKKVYLELDGAGRLRIRRTFDNKQIWESDKSNQPIGKFHGKNRISSYALVVQGDGNIVVYGNYEDPKLDRFTVWATDTDRKTTKPRLSIQNDGNLVLWNSEDNQDRILWQSNTKTLTLGSAAIAIAIASDPGTKQSLATDYARQLETDPNRLTELASRIQVRKTDLKNRFISIGGHVKLLGAGFWPHYEANLDTNGYRAWLDYDPPIFSKGTINIASEGSLAIEGIRIVDSFSAPAARVAQKSVGARSAPTSMPSTLTTSKSATTSTRIAAAPAIAAADTVAVEYVDLTDLLLEETKAPTIAIKNVTVNRAQNSASISYQSTAALQGSVSLYIDTDGKGYNGVQIDDGLVSDNGLQSFTLEDIADRLPADVRAGEKFYIYAVIDDGIHAPVFSKYSKGIAAPDLDPTINTPAKKQTMMVDDLLRFSAENGNAITIDDPVLKLEPEDGDGDGSNKLVVVLTTTGHGWLNLENVPETVEVEGDDSEVLTLTGTAADINAALEDMIYAAELQAESDTITISVRRAESDFLASFITKSINIEIDSFQVNGIESVDIDPDGVSRAIFSTADLDNIDSDVVQTLSVNVTNYRRGKDILSLDIDGIEDILEDGIFAEFDAQRGILNFRGGAMTEATCERLLHNIHFSMTDGSRAKGVEIHLLDDFGEVERLLEALV